MAEILLSGKQPVFVAEYVANELAGGKLTGTEIAVKAGIAPRNAAVYASRSLSNVKIIAAIAERKRLLAEQAAGFTDVDAIRVLREWAEIAVGDPTEIVTARRLNCRYCWGWGFNYQRTDAELARDQADEMQDAIVSGREMRTDAFDGGGGFRITRDPHPNCPECSGEGIADVHIADFRKLTDRQRRMIAGVKQGKHGIEVQFRDQDKALQNLAQYLGLLVNKNEHTGKDGGPIRTANENVNYTLPADPVEAARQYQMLMKGE